MLSVYRTARVRSRNVGAPRSVFREAVYVNIIYMVLKILTKFTCGKGGEAVATYRRIRSLLPVTPFGRDFRSFAAGERRARPMYHFIRDPIGRRCRLERFARHVRSQQRVHV